MGLTSRDLELIRYCEKNFLINAEIASRLVYWTKNEKSSLNIAQRRLKEIVKQQKQVKRVREYIGQSYTYYIGKNPTKTKHRLMVSDFLSRMVADGFEIVLEETQVEYKGLEERYNIRPDLLVTFMYGNKKYQAFVEVDLTKEFSNTKVYEKIYNDAINGKFTMDYPFAIISVCNKKPDGRFIWIKTDWSNFSNIKYTFIK